MCINLVVAATVWSRGASLSCVGLDSSVTTQPSGKVGSEEFAEFYRSRHDWAVRLAFGLTGDRSVAEDLVHDVFARMMPRYDSIEAPVGYLRAGIVNATRSRARRRRTERRHRPAQPEPSFPSYLVEFADALNTLSLRERSAIVLRFLEGLDDREIAREMNCPRSTVRSLVHRGLGKLRTEISL